MKPKPSSEEIKTPFEAFVAAILKVPKDAIKAADDRRLRRASPKREKRP